MTQKIIHLPFHHSLDKTEICLKMTLKIEKPLLISLHTFNDAGTDFGGLKSLAVYTTYTIGFRHIRDFFYFHKLCLSKSYLK